MSDTIRIGILGTGFIADFHARALSVTGGVKLVAACDASASRVASFTKKWGVKGAFTSQEQMLESGRVDVVHILTPPETHVEAALTCMDRDVSVFIEKPMGTSAEQCRRLTAAAARKPHLNCGVNHNAAFHPALQRLIAGIRRRSMGAVEHVTLCVNVPLRQLSAGQHGHWMFHDPGNLILEQAPHPISQIQALLGKVRTASVLPTGATTLKTGRRCFDTWQIALACERGTAQLFLSFGRQFMDCWLHAIGQDAAAHVDLKRNTVEWSGKSRFMEPVDNLRDGLLAAKDRARQAVANFTNYGLSFAGLRPPSDVFSAGIRGSIQEFYKAFAAGGPAPVGLEQGAAVVEACERIVEAAKPHYQEVPDRSKEYVL
jgi:predicted dehydrogenase